jgi:2-oxoisovalerate dehydrogenase E1 component alpha subunit
VCAAREKAVAGGGPTLIEAKCYRFLSHTTDDDDRTYRPREDVERERRNDPLPRFEERLIDLGLSDRAGVDELKAAVAAEVNAMTDRVEREPSPVGNDLYGNVYEGSHQPWR